MRADIAESRMDIDQARLLTMNAARLMDTVGNKAARAEIAMIKVVAPRVALRVIDRAIQAHGAAGVSDDVFLARAWVHARTIRLADGPDEVHRAAVAKVELREARAVGREGLRAHGGGTTAARRLDRPAAGGLDGVVHAGPGAPGRRRRPAVAGCRGPFTVVERHRSPRCRPRWRSARTTSREIVTQYLTRIALYEDTLHAALTVNPRALPGRRRS